MVHLNIMAEYARINNGLVDWVIVADADHISTRTDGSWVLTPGVIDRGYSYEGGIFLSPLTNLSLVAGGPLFLNIKAVASGTCSYQWQKNNVNISGATASTYLVGEVSSTDAGNYTCVVTCGATNVVSNTSIVTVN